MFTELSERCNLTRFEVYALGVTSIRLRGDRRGILMPNTMSDTQGYTKKSASSKKPRRLDSEAVRSASSRVLAYSVTAFITGMADTAGVKTFNALVGAIKGKKHEATENVPPIASGEAALFAGTKFIFIVLIMLMMNAQVSFAGVRDRVLVVTGLQEEAKIAEGPGVEVVLTGGRLQSAMRRLSFVDPSRVRAVISFGIAGGLVLPLRVGSAAMATEVRADDGSVYPVSRALTNAIADQLYAHQMHVLMGPWFAQEIPTLSADGKMALRDYSGAIATDTETLAGAIWANENHLPFAVLRTITDPVDVSLPPAAYNAINSDGSYNVGGVILGTLLNPLQIPGLIDTATDASIGFKQLMRCRRAVDLGSL